MEAAEPGGERGAVGPEPSDPSQDRGAGGPEPPEAPEPVSERLCRGAVRALAVPAERCAGAARALRGFVRGAAGPALLAWRGPGGELGLRPGPPPPPPGASKAVFFLRPPGAGPGPAELLCGDLPADPLAHFAALLEEVIVPILTNRKNHQGWPRVVSQDIIHHVHSLKKTVFMVVGQVKGKTLLPLPAGSEGIENIDPENERFLELVDKSLIHATESAIIDWSHQIQRALKKESSEPLLQGSNPNPKVELEFWKNRCEELECIYDQLRSRKVRNMMEVLERVKSIYVPAFKTMLRDVEAALAEAQDIHLHLTPLQRPLEDIEAVEFSKVKPFLAPLLHMVCWIWATCKHYNVAVRIIVLLQEICNLFIQQAVVYLSPEDLLKGEMEESLGKVQTVLDILNGFKGVFEERRENLHMYYEPGQEVRKWNFHSRMVFARLDSFLKRLEMVKEFEQDALGFQQKVEDIDHRLSTVFTQAFDDTLDLEHIFKLLTMFQSLLERPVIAAVAADKWPVLISMFSTALDHTRLIYCSHTQAGLELGSPPLHKNMPPVAGALAWARELRARIQRPFDRLRHIPHLCLDSAQGRRVVQKYEEMIQLLDRYQDKLYLDWSQTVSEKSQYNLTQPLIRRDPETKLITVNFDPQLVSVLREVSYLSGSRAGAIPATAAGIYSSRESYRQLVANLELMGNRYNKVLRTVLEVEYPLVQGQLQEVDVKLKEAEETLTWKMEGVWDHISGVMEGVHDLEQRLQKAKDNVELIQSIVGSWASPILQRKDSKRDSVLSLEDCQDHLEKRYSLVREAGQRIHSLLKENQSLLLADPASDSWKAYVDYVDEIVLDGFFTAIECSLKYLLENTDPKAGLAPLFEVQLDLVIPDLVFHPSLDPGTHDGFSDMVESLLNGIYRISSLVPRLATHSGFPHYQADLEEMPGLAELRQELLFRVQAAVSSCCAFRGSLERYSHVYGEERRELSRQFLLYGRALTAAELEAQAAVPEALPTLQQFREHIDLYEGLHEEVTHMEPLSTFQGWLRVDARPFKAALLNEVKRWSLLFKQHLLEHVTHSLADLEEFLQTAEKGLSRKVEKGDYEGLVEVMGHLLAVKERRGATDAMFEPLRETIDLLRAYEQDVPGEVHQQLEELPEKWNQVKKLALAVRQHVAPLQADEMTALRQSCAAFDTQQLQFRESFGREAPFRFDTEKPYQLLDTKHMEIKQMESAMASISESAGLFEVMVPEYKQLKQCRKELCLLKELWDMISLVNTSLSDWQTTKWVDINVENMDLECRKFAREIRNLDKEMRAWDAFSGLESKVKNMLTALKAVAELQNPAIRERHWNQLMQMTGVRFVMDSDTTLADLLKLNLHKFEGEVHGIVDKAVREMSMEKVLKELRVTWSTREFQYEPHSRTNVPLLKSDEELIETLEDNQVQLQNLMSSKYIAFFLEEVSAWQRQLSTADAVLSLWFEVQRTWCHLEGIFIGSEDIRAQLPQDSKCFEGIDADFKELAYEVQKTPNVVEATNKPGLSQQLEDIQRRLSLCEKALAEYLDRKRLAFPRFYFISSADLLDILSNGTNPHLVQRHLSKLFDSLAKVKFQVDSEQKATKVGLGMYSREEEYVPFSEPCDCSGQVEVWLSHLLDTMRATVRDEMTAAVTAYEEKPREQWLFDYPAQVALCCTQIWWTTEVGIAFARMKEGYEKAMKEYHKKQVAQLNTLVTMLLGQLSKGDRQKIMTICTIDVHARDVVAKMVAQKPEGKEAQEGSSHSLKFSEKRCYITLTQSLHLTMSGAPAGPAGTGKTETTKDLGRALGVMVYVFNCSEQMDHQVKSVQDAIREKKKSFNFLGEDINLVPSVGIFITMNPGYAGRTELPENLKALFRPCAMVVPDFELICEIMLVAEGFIEARALARKFITLYQLCKELLSKQDHYDWGLRAIKSVLVVAGSLKRADPERPEEQVLMRSLRDFNIPKIVTDDVPVFMGLIGDLFPALGVPRKRDLDFEALVRQAVLELRLQPEDNFVLKVVQLEELLTVRHSVFVVGNAGTGKSQVMRSLHRTHQIMKRRPVWTDLNPKAVTSDELFGVINPATREWKDGLFSSIMRELANLTHDGPKWIVLDGDIDPMWIESLNTVMDDNKVMGTRFKKIIPIPEQSMVQMLCYLLECLLTEENTPSDCPKELYELYFVFAAVWAFGGSMFQDQLVDYRVEFSKWWVAEFKTIKFPSQGTVFDFYIDPETKKFEPWSKLIPQFEFDPEMPLQACLVPTPDTVRVRYLLDRLLERRRPVLLVGTAGTGKSVLVGDKLSSLDTDTYVVKKVPFNYYTTSAMLQGVLEKPLDKKAGRTYGPPGTKRLVYFIDDLNMPQVDTYGTVQPHTLLRQHLDYGHWYDRSRLSLKEITNVQYVSCMNPTAGSFTINPRLQRHFCVFALSNPDQDALTRIYSTILVQHLTSGNFSEAVQKSAQQLIALALGLHRRVAATFLPTAVKFHYVFNLRDFSNIFQGLLFSTPECLKEPQDLLKLYLHESSRVYRDKMVEANDYGTFDKIQREMVKKFYDDVEETLEQTKHMNIFCHFAKGSGEPGYRPVPTWEQLNQILVEALDSYNEVNAAMNLVLFEDAMCHVCRINRILESPRGNVLLVGVGGSGKQSLTRLAAFLSSLEVFQITLRKGYGIPDLKADLANLYLKAGVKNTGTVFLLTDVQVADEQFLVLVNDFLASGEIPDLFPDEEVENIISSVRNEVKGRGMMGSRETCWKFFTERARRQLKDSVKDSISKFMAHVHTSVNEMSRLYLSNERRYNYTTPKSFLEQIKLYQNLLLKKDKDLKAKMERLENGLEKLNSTSAQVDELKAKLAAQEVELKQKSEDADKLIEVVGVETEKVSRKKAVADEEERKVALITQEVQQKQKDCEEDLAKAEPALAAAQAALNTLNKVGGLASENVRWAEAVKAFKEQQSTLCGDVLLITAFVSYLGYFTRKYRQDLLEGIWKPYLHQLKVPIPVSPCLAPLAMLADEAAVAGWHNEGLPADPTSTENAAILSTCERWPLLVDPQLQGIQWIKARYGPGLRVLRLGNKGYLDVLERALAAGELVLIENLEESVDPVLGPLLGRETIKKGRYIKLGDKECELSPAFHLILHTKLANPHFPPELQAQCTLINFTVTRDGLEEQLLAAVVSMERPDLEELKSDLTKQQNGFKITLKTLEDNLLSRLSSASGNFLGDTALVENLEITKQTAAEIEEKVQEFKVTEAKINEAREHYRPAAARASLLYFTMDQLHNIHPMYQFSLKILLMSKEINPAELDFLLRYPAQPGVMSPVEFLSDHSWGGIKALSSMEEFRNLDRDIEGSAKRWRKFIESECPEREKFPQEWKNKSSLQRLCILRALRPDRVTCALRLFLPPKPGVIIGNERDPPKKFLLWSWIPFPFPGSGKKLGFTFNNRNLHNVSLGQGQEVVAEQALDLAAKEGHWVILQDKGNGDNLEYRKFHLNRSNFCCVNGPTLEEAAQRVGGVFILGDIECVAGQPVLPGPALSRG
ncbi:hypothetical protein BTVI_22374 [Pitangus sulphuratus]|nr:hypothetical protein BTVI_22374 [Pitangus sulphuratus]